MCRSHGLELSQAGALSNFHLCLKHLLPPHPQSGDATKGLGMAINDTALTWSYSWSASHAKGQVCPQELNLILPGQEQGGDVLPVVCQ